MLNIFVATSGRFGASLRSCELLFNPKERRPRRNELVVRIKLVGARQSKRRPETNSEIKYRRFHLYDVPGHAAQVERAKLLPRLARGKDEAHSRRRRSLLHRPRWRMLCANSQLSSDGRTSYLATFGPRARRGGGTVLQHYASPTSRAKVQDQDRSRAISFL